jgi:hypothetical protein
MTTTEPTTTPEPALILSHGKHNNAGGDGGCTVCLLEACSLPIEILDALEQRDAKIRARALKRLREVRITDHPDDVCSTRAAFGRALNDSYPLTTAGDAERTEDLGSLTRLLRGTAARNDSAAVAARLLNVSLHDWWPRLPAKLRAEIEGLTAPQLREALAQEIVRRSEQEFVAGQAIGAAQQGQQQAGMLTQVIARLLAHYTRAGALAPDERYLSLEASMPMGDAQARLPETFQIGWQMLQDPMDPRRQVFFVKLFRPELQPVQPDSEKPALVGADGRPVS